MSDFSDATEAIKTTVSALLAAGVDPMAVAATLATASVKLYEEIDPQHEISEHDVSMLFSSLNQIAK